jgi:hypothetical protein
MSEDCGNGMKVMRLWCISRRLKTPDHNELIIDSAERRIVLNRTGSMIWRLIDDNRSVTDIVQTFWQKVQQEPGATLEGVRQTVTDFLQDLRERRLVVFGDAPGVWSNED